MVNVIDELLALENRCLHGADFFKREEVKQGLQAIMGTVEAFNRSWSRSWLGYQARVYYGDFEPVPPGAEFSIDWGLNGPPPLTTTKGDWREYSYQGVCDEVFRRAGNPDLEVLRDTSAEMLSVFEECQHETLAVLDATLAEAPDKRLQELRDAVAKTKPGDSEDDFAQSMVPNREYSSQDWRALEGGTVIPPHLAVKSRMMTLYSRGRALAEIGKAAKQARLYLEKRMDLKGERMAPKNRTVFIGHGGRSQAWRDLKDLLQDRLRLKPDEFNMEPAAGMTTKERLEEMLNSAVFAFLVMTGEDEHSDKTTHARENVIHEVGLFQGALGFRRAIVLLEHRSV